MRRRLLKTNRWRPLPAPPATEPTQPLNLVRIPVGGHGPEDVRFDDAGHIVTGLDDGTVLRIDLGTGARTVLGNTGGRPLGLNLRPDGSILICDHDLGLVRMSADGVVTVLVSHIDGEQITFASNSVQGSDGTIWFTTSTRRWDVENYQGDLAEHSLTGRLVRVATDGTVTVVIPDLAFANGLVLSPDESYLLYAETARYQVSSYRISDGRRELFAENLPGFPDNISLGSDGNVWVALANPRNKLLDVALPLWGVVRMLIWNLPAWARPQPTAVGWAVAFDLDGALVHDLRVADGSFSFVTSVAELNGTIVLGSLHEEAIAVATLR